MCDVVGALGAALGRGTLQRLSLSLLSETILGLV